MACYKWRPKWQGAFDIVFAPSIPLYHYKQLLILCFILKIFCFFFLSFNFLYIFQQQSCDYQLCFDCLLIYINDSFSAQKCFIIINIKRWKCCSRSTYNCLIPGLQHQFRWGCQIIFLRIVHFMFFFLIEQHVINVDCLVDCITYRCNIFLFWRKKVRKKAFYSAACSFFPFCLIEIGTFVVDGYARYTPLAKLKRNNFFLFFSNKRLFFQKISGEQF